MSEAIRPREYFLKKGYIFIPAVPTLIATVVGTGIAVCLWDRKKQRGGMNHFLFPRAKNRSEATPVFGNASILALVKFFREDGSEIKNLEAQIFGGAVPEESSPEAARIARANVHIARTMLGRYGIPIVAEDVGGHKGRKVVFHSHNGDVAVIHADRIRKSDWYPYDEGER
ncbi:chemotaxis protein CheD [Thermodesulforhabdus norvegica]|uniref:Probable chemoreceptor glutamine deamidase CheD n=1 Tax=Thermodesulforhabdus norvegica TaxID=39841 RepID=A0A1I4RDT7_9BACT|nr:chemotaxis protein CheD [Thermodesulforhabdus norvegica]SFM50441.1 chemotaxis protein CheD [Thermodesulforhabdus norvegica]